MVIDGVTSTSSTSSATQSTAPSQSGMDGLGEDAFMKLLLAQLQNQDPLKPMEDKDFIAQLAQFNSLNQMTSIKETLESMFSLMSDNMLNGQTLSEGSALIGKNVTGLNEYGNLISGMVSGLHILGEQVVLDLEGQTLPLDMVESVQGITEGSNDDGGQDQSASDTTYTG